MGISSLDTDVQIAPWEVIFLKTLSLKDCRNANCFCSFHFKELLFIIPRNSPQQTTIRLKINGDDILDLNHCLPALNNCSNSSCKGLNRFFISFLSFPHFTSYLSSSLLDWLLVPYNSESLSVLLALPTLPLGPWDLPHPKQAFALNTDRPQGEELFRQDLGNLEVGWSGFRPVSSWDSCSWLWGNTQGRQPQVQEVPSALPAKWSHQEWRSYHCSLVSSREFPSVPWNDVLTARPSFEAL